MSSAQSREKTIHVVKKILLPSQGSFLGVVLILTMVLLNSHYIP